MAESGANPNAVLHNESVLAAPGCELETPAEEPGSLKEDTLLPTGFESSSGRPRTSSRAVEPRPVDELRPHRVAAAFCALAILYVLPHRHPFEASIPLQLTFFVWAWKAPILLGCLLLTGYLWKRSQRAPKALYRSAALLCLACLFTELLRLRSFESFPPGNLGFLRLCVDWCGGNPFDDCYRAAAPPRRTGAQDARAARTFFASDVYGAAPVVRATAFDGSAVAI